MLDEIESAAALFRLRAKRGALGDEDIVRLKAVYHVLREPVKPHEWTLTDRQRRADGIVRSWLAHRATASLTDLLRDLATADQLFTGAAIDDRPARPVPTRSERSQRGLFA